MKPIGIAVWSTAALMAAAGVAQAAPPPNPNLPWTYVEAAYLKADGSDDYETDAYELRGSLALSNIFHAQAYYLDGSVDGDDGDDGADFDGYRVAFGAHPQVTANTQFVTNLFYFDYEVDPDYPGDDASSDGYGIDVGFRHSLSEKAEASLLVRYTEGSQEYSYDGGEGCCSFDEDFNDTSVEAQIRYNWTQNLSTGFTAGFNGGFGDTSYTSGDDFARIDLRWSFGRGGFDSLNPSDGISDDSY
jgi:hypothetical protein